MAATPGRVFHQPVSDWEKRIQLKFSNCVPLVLNVIIPCALGPIPNTQEQADEAGNICESRHSYAVRCSRIWVNGIWCCHRRVTQEKLFNYNSSGLSSDILHRDSHILTLKLTNMHTYKCLNTALLIPTNLILHDAHQRKNVAK